MVDDAATVGAECVKFQCHVVDDEMIPNDVVPGNANESIEKIIRRCTFDEAQERFLKGYVEKKGMLYLSTPFSRAAADRLESMGVLAYKIGSGECNNTPLIEHIASFKKPIILSTGMNDIPSIERSVAAIGKYGTPFALLHCTSVYPTPYSLVRLGAIGELRAAFPDAPIGLSDHTKTIYPCLGAVSLGASILERHFTSDAAWLGPDIEVSMTPEELQRMIVGSAAIWESRGGRKAILAEEAPTIAFAYASVVSTRAIAKGDKLDGSNIWVKRPGTGEIRAIEFEAVVGRHANRDIPADTQLKRDWLS
jgi:N-acetylneuraminate synthase